jgi:hypothetical protein
MYSQQESPARDRMRDTLRVGDAARRTRTLTVRDIEGLQVTDVQAGPGGVLRHLREPEPARQARGCLAYGFRNPVNQRRRVRIARTRGYRRKPRTA